MARWSCTAFSPAPAVSWAAGSVAGWMAALRSRTSASTVVEMRRLMPNEGRQDAQNKKKMCQLTKIHHIQHTYQMRHLWSLTVPLRNYTLTHSLTVQLLRRHVAFMFILANRRLELKRLFARLAVAGRHLVSNALTLLMMSCSKPASVVVYMYDDNSRSSCVARDCSSELAAPVSSASTSCTLSSGKIVSSVSPSHACSLFIIRSPAGSWDGWRYNSCHVVSNVYFRI